MFSGTFLMGDNQLVANSVVTMDVQDWASSQTRETQKSAVEALEQGHVLYFPALAFSTLPDEARFFSPDWSNGRAKNISFSPAGDGAGSAGSGAARVKGLTRGTEDVEALATMMQRFADAAQGLVVTLLPQYRQVLMRARTSFRPVEIEGRPSSASKDDTLLHVDAFPSSPTRGGRILRVFCNANPDGKTRNWRLGEPFPAYARRFLPRVRDPLPGTFSLLHTLRITKARRSLYDHYMLRLHDLGKMDHRYQKHCPQQDFAFPAGSTWMCFTDQVLHAAQGGQYLLEQTFHLPVSAMEAPAQAPLEVLETLLGRPMV
jgi:hypothetical protein